MAIDDKFDQIEQQYANAGKPTVLDIVLRLSAAIPVLGSFIAPFDAIQQFRAFEDFRQRVEAYQKGLEESVRDLSQDVEGITARFQDEKCRLAFTRGIAEAAQSLTVERASDFGRIFGGELASTNPVWDEASALIRDLNQLTDSDVEVLRLLFRFQSRLVKQAKPTSDDPRYDRLQETVPGLLREVAKGGHSRHEFYSRASRLTGFGLAIQLNQPQVRLPWEPGFAITARGVRLVELLHWEG